MELAESVAAVRAFNRFWTNRIGVLDAGLLDTPYSLTEARVIFELAQAEAMDLKELRAKVGIDPGYLSRIVNRLKREGLAVSEASPADGRRRVIRLTERGRAVFDDLDSRSARQIEGMLTTAAEEDQRRALAAMDALRAVFDARSSPRAYVIRSLRPGDLGWVVHRHGVLYAREYGWDEHFEALVARVVADYVDNHDPKRENAWIAELDGEPVGCVFCVKKDDDVAKLRLLLVEPAARGMGIGARLVDECIRFAEQAGYKQMTLWTNDVLVAARRIYEARGFRLIAEERYHGFGHDLVGQDWLLDLD